VFSLGKKRKKNKTLVHKKKLFLLLKNNMGKGVGIAKELFFIILICIAGFLIHLKIVDWDHNSCSEEIKTWMDKILDYQKNMWDLKLPSSIWWIDLSKFNLNNLKATDVDLNLTSINYIKMRYTWLDRTYDATVWIKLRNAKLKDLNIDIPITCNVVDWKTTIKYRKTTK